MTSACECSDRNPPSLVYLLTVLQDPLLGADAALGSGGVDLPLGALHVDVHVEFTTEHGHLGLRQQTHGHVGRHLGGGRETVNTLT